MNSTLPLNADEIGDLDDFLISDNAPETAMDVCTLDGFFAALVLHPQIIMPSEYLPWIWDEDEGKDAPAFASLDEANRILGLIMRHYNSVLEAIRSDQFEPLFDVMPQEDGSELFDAEGWSWGFMLGVTLFPEPWDAVFKERPELISSMVLLGTEAGWDLLEETGDSKRATQEAYGNISGAVAMLYDYFSEQREAATRERLARPGRHPSGMMVEASPMRNVHIKVGRNDLCPCGSGKKFKKCCGAAPTLH